MKFEKQAYNLGRVYRILEDNDNALAHNDAIRDQAPAKPVAALGSAFRICMANRSIPKSVETLIMNLLDDVDVDYPSPASNELQGCWWIGYHASPKAELGDKVLFARKQADLTQKELSEKTGLSQSEISMIESGKLTPSSVAIKAISSVIDLK